MISILLKITYLPFYSSLLVVSFNWCIKLRIILTFDSTENKCGNIVYPFHLFIFKYKTVVILCVWQDWSWIWLMLSVGNIMLWNNNILGLLETSTRNIECNVCPKIHGNVISYVMQFLYTINFYKIYFCIYISMYTETYIFEI